MESDKDFLVSKEDKLEDLPFKFKEVNLVESLVSKANQEESLDSEESANYPPTLEVHTMVDIAVQPRL